MISDIRMPGMDGMSLLERLTLSDRELPVILITGHAEVSLAVEAMRRGAYDFIEKPFATQALAAVLRRALDHRALVIENRRLRAVAGQRDDLVARLPGRSAAVIELRRLVRTLGPSEADALVTGPTGAGKEVVAQAMHDLSPRAGRPFVAINCAALPAQLIESELFGHEAGPFRAPCVRAMAALNMRGGARSCWTRSGRCRWTCRPPAAGVAGPGHHSVGSNDPIALDVRFLATSKAILPRPPPEAPSGRTFSIV